MNTDRRTALLEAAYDEYADAIFRHCYFRLLKRERAKELMQETFLKVFEYLRKGKEIENMRALLYRIANNLVIDDVRKKKEVSLDAIMEAGVDPTGGGEETVKEIVDGKRVTAIIGRLEKSERELVVLRYVDGFKPREIAEMMNLSPNVVSVRLHRAMHELKTLLKEP